MKDCVDIHAGFPSPAQDYMEGVIDLNRELVRHPDATFFARVAGDSMVDAGIWEDDVLIVDKSLDPVDGDICVCSIEGEFCIKFFRVDSHSSQVFLEAANRKYSPIAVSETDDVAIWGVVTYVIHDVKK